ncbi:hypothetical protein IP88_10120 [alpha proteobacterium AAP81b]|nr:hypothetical protein IP88_10120 [alpha proteobacterium AAP81b]
MIFTELPVTEAAGTLLAHSIVVAGRRWAKGRRLSPDDIAEAAAAGIAALTVARLAGDDIDEDRAAAALATALAGSGITTLPAAHGRANLAAQHAGIIAFDAAMVAAVNAADEAITLGTLAPLARVAAGEIVATVKIIRYAVPAATLAATLAVHKPLAVLPLQRRTMALIATALPGTGDKALARTLEVTRRRVEALGSTIAEQPPVAHATAALAAALAAAPGDLILVAGASATVDRGDVIPAAIVAAGGRVERLGMPVDPGNLLCLGWLGHRAVIGLPGCARSPKRNGLDFVLERLVAGLPVTAADIAAMGVGGLLPEAERPQPRVAAAPPQRCGAIILAAGRSTRMGGGHKLLEAWRGLPLITHVADAVAAAGLPPPVVVLGARADDVRAALGDREANFVVAADFAEGLSRSLRAGIAAVPAEWDAALVCLADMPRIEPELLAALAAAPGDVALPVWQGKRGNPVRWSRRHFAALMGLEGDVGGKAVLADAAELTEVAAPSDAVLDDIDTPAALAALRARA